MHRVKTASYSPDHGQCELNDWDLDSSPAISGDLDGDNDVDYVDFSSFLSAFGAHTGDAGYLESADLDQDGSIGCSDYQEFLSISCMNPPALSAAKYAWGSPSPGYRWDGAVFESWMKAYVENTGAGTARNVRASILTTPSNVTVIDGQIYFGDIAPGQSKWSGDTFRIRTDTDNPSDPGATISWKFEYDKPDGTHVVEVVPQVPTEPFCP